MCRALAIETSGRIGSVALSLDGVVLAVDDFPHGLQHAAEIIPRIDALCRSQGWQPRDLEEVYVSAGPGSFTGLRIGVTLAKTLAFATGVKLVAVPSLDVLVRNSPPEAMHAIVVLDAKRDQIYTARYTRQANGEWQAAEPAHLDSLAQMLSRAPRPVYLLGDGIPFHQKFILADEAAVTITPPQAWRALASVVAQIGHRMARAGQFTEAQALLPIYIRKPEAEEKWDALHSVLPRG